MSECRFYQQQYPTIDELVVASVKRIEETAVYVTLPEYGHIEGMIQLSELSKTRIRSIAQIIRVGKQINASVLRVDLNKGYVDLSRKRVVKMEVPAFEERVARAKFVHSMMWQIAHQKKCAQKDICEKISWPLYAKFGHAYDAFVKIVNGDESVLEGLELEKSLRESLEALIKKKFTPAVMKLRAEVEVMCYGYEGINGVRDALIAGRDAVLKETTMNGCASQNQSTGAVSIRLIAPPNYLLVTQATNKEVGIQRLESCINAIKSEIEKKEGRFNVTKKPEIIGEEDDIFKTSKDEEETSDSSSSDEEEDETMGEVRDPHID